MYDATMDRAAFLRRAAALGVLATTGAGALLGTGGLLGAGEAVAAAPVTGGPAATGRRGRRGLRYRGVAYDTGTALLGSMTRPRWSGGMLATDLRAIDEQLGCSAVTVFGSEIARLRQAATAALDRGLQVSIQPRLFDEPRPDILHHLADAARSAERLRVTHAPEVILVVGCEYLLFAPGIVPGDTFLDRIEYLRGGQYDFAVLLRRLNAFIAEAVAVARRHFGGRITYGAAAGLEEVDWSPFDIVGLDYYDFSRRRRDHTRKLARYRRWNKPIMILEFGCCTFRGAAELGGDGWSIVDWTAPQPRIPDGYRRCEREQADHLAFMLDVFEAEGLLGASPYTFISPDLPHSPIPRLDLDMASYSLVKVIRKDYADPASPYRWEPKLSFHAVARHNRARREAGGRL